MSSTQPPSAPWAGVRLLLALGSIFQASAPRNPQDEQQEGPNDNNASRATTQSPTIAGHTDQGAVHSQEEFEEALGYLQGHIGRIKGMVAKAQAAAVSLKN